MSNRFTRIGALLAAAALLLAGCAGGGTGEPAGGDELPDWVLSIQPRPGSSSTANTVIEVEHAVTEPDVFIRLIVDGTDVTATAADPRGLLTYQIVESGPHTATLERVRLPAVGEDEVVLDTFTWTFDTL